jgi:DNA-binding MarR family transcriptional regulator
MHEYAHKRIAESMLMKLNDDEIKTLEKLLAKVLEDK